ncbi:MAG: MerR family transcriptional regulator [Candidatus Dadabacteria bacterium]|nr:MerR family transcriptional regulator [Candidatus Dadabacteria bacterium]NIV42164.1 MerR family transcriptional regulator [Candidatus Dadabacteria bacterium]NIX16503.1 MerR family transcriptional regulator [Candidatus Dadabacteria bacterium]
MSSEKKKKNTADSSKTKIINGLGSKQVVELIDSLEGVKLTYDQLYYYESTGLVVPSVRSAQGRGVSRLYSVEDIIILRWIAMLNKKGISIQGFRSVFEFIKKKMPEILKKPQNYALITDGKSVQFFDKISSRTLDVLKDTGQYLFFFPVGKMAEQSEEAIEKLGSD